MNSNDLGFRSSDNLTKWVRYMLYLQIVVAGISLISGLLEYKLLSDYESGVYTSQELATADGEANDIRQGMIGTIYLLVFIISGFLILRWIHRANYNARQLGANNMKFTPGWSVGYYFIPILTWWKPYQAMKEIWKASKNPSDWESQQVSGILPVWWTLWLVSNVLGQVIFRFSMHADDLSEFITLNVISQISDVLDVPLALALLFVVNRVHGMQMSHLTKSSGLESSIS